MKVRESKMLHIFCMRYNWLGGNDIAVSDYRVTSILCRPLNLFALSVCMQIKPVLEPVVMRPASTRQGVCFVIESHTQMPFFFHARLSRHGKKKIDRVQFPFPRLQVQSLDRGWVRMGSQNFSWIPA